MIHTGKPSFFKDQPYPGGPDVEPPVSTNNQITHKSMYEQVMAGLLGTFTGAAAGVQYRAAGIATTFKIPVPDTAVYTPFTQAWIDEYLKTTGEYYYRNRDVPRIEQIENTLPWYIEDFGSEAHKFKVSFCEFKEGDVEETHTDTIASGINVLESYLAFLRLGFKYKNIHSVAYHNPIGYNTLGWIAKGFNGTGSHDRMLEYYAAKYFFEAVKDGEWGDIWKEPGNTSPPHGVVAEYFRTPTLGTKNALLFTNYTDSTWTVDSGMSFTADYWQGATLWDYAMGWADRFSGFGSAAATHVTGEARNSIPARSFGVLRW